MWLNELALIGLVRAEEMPLPRITMGINEESSDNVNANQSYNKHRRL